jgi:hypothetical protein
VESNNVVLNIIIKYLLGLIRDADRSLQEKWKHTVNDLKIWDITP